MLSARLTKVLIHLITSLGTCACNAGEHVAKFGDKAENNQEITVAVQGNYNNFKHLAYQKNFVMSKVQRTPANVWKMPSQSSKVPENDN